VKVRVVRQICKRQQLLLLLVEATLILGGSCRCWLHFMCVMAFLCTCASLTVQCPYALQLAGRARDVRIAGEVSQLVERIAEGQGLTQEDYLAVINSQFWLKQDHEQLLQTVAAMKDAGYELDQCLLHQLLHVYCHNGMWGEALQVLNDVAAGRFSQQRSSSNSSRSKHQRCALKQGAERAAVSAAEESALQSDQLWHVVLRKLWEKRVSDELLNDFLRHMSPAQLQRFKLVYGLQPSPEQPGHYTLQPLEDWQLPLQQQQQQQQGQEQQQQHGEQQQHDEQQEGSQEQ
jgi:pentatricopeptide repeat protein